MPAKKQMRSVVKTEEALYGRADTERSRMHHRLNVVEDEMFVGIQATTMEELQSHLRTRTWLLQTCRKLLLEKQLQIGKLRKQIREQQQQKQHHQKHRQQQYQQIYSHHHRHHLQEQQQQQQQSEQVTALLAAAVAPVAVAPAAAEVVHSPAGGAAEPALAFIPAAAPVAAQIALALQSRHNYFTRMNSKYKTEK
jgi:cation transport ATPase